MKLKSKCWLCFSLLLSCGTATYSQASLTGENSDCFVGAVRDFQDRFATTPPNRGMAMNDIMDLSVFVCYFSIPSVRAKFLGVAEQNRLDKQPGASSDSSGSTSLVSKGSSPWLLGFALEHGGLTQTTSGNTITFRGNVANSIRALMNSTYLGSYALGDKDKLVQGLSKLSFGVSFDTSANQPSTSQGFTPSKENFSGFSSKYEIINRRDPRNHKWDQKWAALDEAEALELAGSFSGLNEEVEANPNFQQWATVTEGDIAALSPTPTEPEIRALLKRSAELFGKLLLNAPEAQNRVNQVTSRMTGYLSAENDILNTIRTSSLLTVEYNYSRQLTTNNQNVAATVPSQQLPTLSNINIVYEKGFQGANAPELTFNAGVTLFNSTSSTPPKYGTVRDYRFSAQLDVPLKEIANIGKPVLSFSGEFLGLLEQPLGQKVMLNGVTVDRRGNMGIFQGKLSIPVKDSGVKIPVSFTYASRTELIKEKDVRGNIGITFDLDTLFSKAK